MKKTKYLTAILLFFLSFVLIGEFYVWNLYTFSYDFPYTTLYLQEGQEKKELFSDVISAADKTGVEVFTVDVKINNIVSTEVHIYGTKGVKDKLQSQKIEDGSYKSLILGDIGIKIEDFTQIPDELIPYRFVLIGSHSDNLSFKRLLINKYAGNLPAQVEYTNQNVFMIGGLWFAVFAFLLLISLYDLALMKKESIVRMVSGEPLLTFVSTNILKDCCAFCFIFFSLLLFTGTFTQSAFFLKITLISFLLFLIINTLLHLTMLRVDFRKDIGSKENAKKVLGISYVYKCVVMVLTIFIVSGNVQLIGEEIEYFRQKDFFEKYKDYYYMNVSRGDETDPYSDPQILKNLMSDERHFTLVDLQTSDEGVECIYADRTSRDYINEQIPSFQELDLDSKIYILIPRRLKDNSFVKEKALETGGLYYGGPFDYEFIEYNHARIMSIKDIGTKIESKHIKNPVIIYNNFDLTKYQESFYAGYIQAATLFHIEDDDLARIDSKGQINYITNANENYRFHFEAAKKNMMAGISFLGLILMLNVVISKSMLYYEYKIRAVEYTLKKILGEHPLVSNMRIFLISVISAGVALAISSVIMLVLQSRVVVYHLFGSMMVLFLDFCFSVYYIRIMSKMSIARIFKGGGI